jgi:uracil-DNA glycosylase
MGFCYPGTGDSGDLPPRKECAELWHDALLTQMKRVRLTMLIGKYAQNQRLPGAKGVALTSTVQCWRAHAPSIFPLPHPSPRNNRWLKKNAWLSSELLPHLQREIQSVLYTA